MEDFTHFNSDGLPRMVDVSEQAETKRTATAFARVRVNETTFALIGSGGIRKGDVFAAAQIAGIMAAKRTAELIPMCHPVFLTGVDFVFSMDPDRFTVEIWATASCMGATGVEMEALTAASVAALTVYDMCKSVQRDIEIERVFLVEKRGGKSGTYRRKEG